MDRKQIEGKYDEFFGTGYWEVQYKQHIVEFAFQCSNDGNTILADSLPLSELKDLLCEVSQLIAGWNATEAEWSKWDEEVKQKVYQLQLKIDDKKAVNFR